MFRDLRERASAVETEANAARDALDASTDELKSRLDELETARAAKANLDLAAHFKTLAEGETRLSWIFRGVTAALLVAASALGLWGVAASDDVREAIGHAALVLTLGGAAAYSSRLGASHRITGDWSSTIKIQLDTFEAFLATVDNSDVKDRVYEEFGRRVLGSPPRVGRGVGEDPSVVPMAQVLDIATTLAKR